ncbi:unnamed protein product [Spirodela intermedia]|uniref:Beta-Casp domain-containing protein n=1 Tax=Spirodela intermedia TaxID=51605 RepID=A0A7I8IYK5_SPIIN|nr:unnamed protein product [Spirodela intermedia]CAA6662092.1 unnamed protein product [Spirodela intermedia]
MKLRARLPLPPCHMIDLGGFCILLECPDEEEEEGKEASLSVDGLINSVPWYKTVGSLGLWDVSLIDVVVISSPMGILGLPILTRNSNFSAKIYATEVTTKIGQLMMEDLVTMHEEALQFFGPGEEFKYPEWMTWNELEKYPQVIRTIVMGNVAEELGSWFPCTGIYVSKAEIDECIKKVQTAKYAEECCYNSSLIFKAFSSGLEIGGANWTIHCPGSSVTYLTSSIFKSATAMEFNYHDLQGNDFILFSDFSSFNDAGMSNSEKEPLDEPSSIADRSWKKINFISSCVVETAKGGGSVLIPIGRLGIILQLLEVISQALEALELKVPMYIISSAAEEMLALANVFPEWVSSERQQKVHTSPFHVVLGTSLFGHAELTKESKLQFFPVIHSPDFMQAWQEPCIVFSPHWSLRLGPAVHLLRRWHADENCLLILESGVDADVALSPFMPIAMKVLRCSFLSGLPIRKVHPLLEFLKSKHILFPEDLRPHVPLREGASFLYYSENRTMAAPNPSDGVEADLSIDLARQLRPRRMLQETMAISRLKGKLQLSYGRHLLAPTKAPSDLPAKRLLWGPVDRSLLLHSLAEKGIIESSVEQDDGGRCRIFVQDGDRRAVVELGAAPAVIAAADERLAALLHEALCSASDGI